MIRRILGSLLLTTLVCAQATADSPKLETAVFAGGCFWSMQHDLEHVPGVTSIQVGYTGGHVDNPTYKQVSAETTGHFEAVKVTFDPSKISYGALVERYWHVVDPTDFGGAFCDRGDSYHSAIFVGSADQRRIADASKTNLRKQLGAPIATEIKDAATFWPAEDYHQHFPTKNPDRYNTYRRVCGKDAKLAKLWGDRAFH